jgi:hypothetical protein
MTCTYKYGKPLASVVQDWLASLASLHSKEAIPGYRPWPFDEGPGHLAQSQPLHSAVFESRPWVGVPKARSIKDRHLQYNGARQSGSVKCSSCSVLRAIHQLGGLLILIGQAGRHDWFYYTSTKCAIPDDMRSSILSLMQEQPQAGRHSWFYYTKRSAPSQMTSHDSNALWHW